MMIEINDAAQMFRALGEPTRLRLVAHLGCCPETVNGPTAGELCCQTTGAKQITSTISHHLKELRESNLIQTEKHGKSVCCSLDRDSLRDLVKFLESILAGQKHECC